MSLVTQLGYIGFEVKDLAAWEDLTINVLGLMKEETRNEGFDLRIDSYKRRIFIDKGDSDDVSVIGFEVKNQQALEHLIASLESAGIKTERGTSEDLALREVKGMVKCHDPSGIPLEFYYGPTKANAPFQSNVVEAGFVAEELGFGHVVVSCLDPEANRKFYMEILGFLLSDTMSLKFGNHRFDITFTHINARHHSLAFSSPMPKRVHHFMIQTARIDDVGKAYDRARNHKVPITQELGRHSNDQMLSFYAKTPSGFEFEFGADAIEIDDRNWTPKNYDRGSDWGHRRPSR